MPPISAPNQPCARLPLQVPSWQGLSVKVPSKYMDATLLRPQPPGEAPVAGSLAAALGMAVSEQGSQSVGLKLSPTAFESAVKPPMAGSLVAALGMMVNKPAGVALVTPSLIRSKAKQSLAPVHEETAESGGGQFF